MRDEAKNMVKDVMKVAIQWTEFFKPIILMISFSLVSFSYTTPVIINIFDFLAELEFLKQKNNKEVLR